MSVEALAVVLNHSRASGVARLVLLGIANHDGDGGAFPSKERLARYANTHEDNIRKHLRVLEQLGEIITDPNGGQVRDQGGKLLPKALQPNLYRVTLQCPPECDGTTQHRITAGESRGGNSAPWGEGVIPPPGVGVIPPPKPPSQPSTKTKPSSSTPDGAAGGEQRQDVEDLCNLLADLVEGNGARRPKITKGWRDECRRMLDIDQRDPVKAAELIRWVQADSFWRSNVLSMATFRAKYDQLQMKGREAWQRTRGTGTRPAQGHTEEWNSDGFDFGMPGAEK